jgi:hypothetical protein
MKLKNRKVTKIEKTAEEFAALPSLCAWPGCNECFQGVMPQGWNYLLLWWAPRPQPNRTVASIVMDERCARDHVLCPEHSMFFDRPKLDTRLEGLPAGRC